MKLRGKMIAGFVVVCLFIGEGMTAYATVSSDWSNNLSAIESNVREVLGLLNSEKKIVQAKEAQIEGLNVQIDNTNNDIKAKDIEINTLKEEITSLEAAHADEVKHLQLNIDELDGQQQDLVKTRNRLQKEKADLEAEISELNGTINSLKAENNRKNEKINEDEQTINSMEAEIEKMKNYTEERVEEAKAESTTSESSEAVQGST